MRRKNVSLLLAFFFSLSPLCAEEEQGGGTRLPGGEEFFDGEELSDSALLLEGEGSIAVTGTVETTQQMAVIGKEEIEKRNAPDLAALLQETLNIGFTRYGGRGNMAGINLRGFDSKRVALLVDGIPVNSAMDGKFDIDQIDLNSVERVEVIQGGSDAKYNVSGALGGAINIVTVKKREPGLSLGASVSNTSAMPGKYRDSSGKTRPGRAEDLFDGQSYSLDAAYGSGGGFSFGANAFANRTGNHFLFTDYVGNARRKADNEAFDAGAGASFVWEFPSLSKIIASSKFFYGDRNIPGSGFSLDAGTQRDISARQTLMLDMPRAFHDELAAELSLACDFADRVYVSPADAESRHDQIGAAAINRWNWYPAGNLVLRGGLDYRFTRLDSTEIGERLRHDGGAQLAVEWKPRASFLVVPSIKAAFSSGGNGGATPIPKLGLLWNINDSFSLKNNYFRSFKFPDFEELYWSGGGGLGNPDLRPEDGWGTDLGGTWNFRELFRLDAAAFAQRTDGSIHWYSKNSGVWRPENVGTAVFFGLDGKLRFEIPVSLGPVKKLVPSFSYQYLLSYLLCYGYDYSSDKRIPYMPAHTAGTSLEIPWKTGSLIVSAHYESPRYADTANLTELKPNFLLNASANQKIGSLVSVFVAFRNILDESYESFYDYPMPGFTMTVGIKTRLEGI